jgi:hypothetical protein
LNKILHHSVTLRCDTGRAFGLFTISRQVESWLIKPFSQKGFAEIEPVTGGKYELFWEEQNKQENSTIGCHITALADGEFLSFDWKGPTEFKSIMNNTEPLTQVTVFFIPVADSSTRVHLIHSGWGSSREWEAARTYFEKAWNSAFENLRLMINGK